MALLKTASGRVSRTKTAAYIGTALQIVTALLAVLGVIGLESWAGVASALGIVQGILKSLLRDVTSEPMATKPKPPTGATLILIVLLAVGCGTLKVQAEDYSHLDLRVQSPHSVIVTTDGEVVFEQRGAMSLRLRAAKGTALIADEACDSKGMCVLRRVAP